MNRQMCWLICCSLVCFALYVFDDAWNLKLVMYWYIYIFFIEKKCQTLLKMDGVQEGFLVLSILILMEQNLTFPRNKYFSVVRKTPWNLIMDWYIVCTVILWIIPLCEKYLRNKCHVKKPLAWLCVVIWG